MKTIKLLLTENVPNLGIVGDVVSVKPGYARNYLLPMGLATQPTEGNINRLSERRAQVEEQMRQLRAKMETMIEKLEGYEITIERSANEQGLLYGGVSQHDIAELLQVDGFDLIEDRHVRIGDKIERLDSYTIPVALDSDLQTEIKLWVVSDRPMDQEPDEEDEPGTSEDVDSEEQRQIEVEEEIAEDEIPTAD